MDDEKMITLTTSDGEKLEFYVLEETRISGMNYLLVTDAGEDDEEGECYIFYEFVEDDSEMDYLFNIFAELMEDMDVDLRK